MDEFEEKWKKRDVAVSRLADRLEAEMNDAAHGDLTGAEKVEALYKAAINAVGVRYAIGKFRYLLGTQPPSPFLSSIQRRNKDA